MTTDGLARLGELRRRQGRLDEAASLFDRSGAHPVASLGRAAMALDRGDERRRGTRGAASAPPAGQEPHRTRGRAGTADSCLRRPGRIRSRPARAALDELRSIAATRRRRRCWPSASLAAGLIALAEGDDDAAPRARGRGRPASTTAARRSKRRGRASIWRGRWNGSVAPMPRSRNSTARWPR